MAGGGGYGVERKPRKEKASVGPNVLAGQRPVRGTRVLSEVASANPIPACHRRAASLGAACQALSVTQMFQMMGSALPRPGNTPGIPAGCRANPAPWL